MGVRCVLKVENVRDRRRSTGRLFQARGPAMARARSPMVECHVLHIAGARTSAVDAEHSRRRECCGIMQEKHQKSKSWLLLNSKNVEIWSQMPIYILLMVSFMLNMMLSHS